MRRARFRQIWPSLAALVLLSACSNYVEMGQLIPWYAPLIQRSLDFSTLLPREYRTRPIVLHSLNGPDARSPLATTRSWLIFVQDRKPQASLVAVLDEQLAIALQTTSTAVGTDPRRWLIDAQGRLLLDGLMISPPNGQGSAWAAAAAPNGYSAHDRQAWLTVSGASLAASWHYPLYLSVDTAGSLGAAGSLYLGRHQNNPGLWLLDSFDGDWAAAPIQAPVLIAADFLTSHGAVLFPGIALGANPPAPAPSVSIDCLMAEVDAAKGRMRLYCLAAVDGDWSQPSPLFVIDLPWKQLASMNPLVDTISFQVLSDSTSPQAIRDRNAARQIIVPTSTGGCLRTLAPFEDSHGVHLTLLSNLATGELGKRLELLLPGNAGSSLGQQPYQLAGQDYWLAIDGGTERLQVCAPWWK